MFTKLIFGFQDILEEFNLLGVVSDLERIRIILQDQKEELNNCIQEDSFARFSLLSEILDPQLPANKVTQNLAFVLLHTESNLKKRLLDRLPPETKQKLADLGTQIEEETKKSSQSTLNAMKPSTQNQSAPYSTPTRAGRRAMGIFKKKSPPAQQGQATSSTTPVSSKKEDITLKSTRTFKVSQPDSSYQLVTITPYDEELMNFLKKHKTGFGQFIYRDEDNINVSNPRDVELLNTIKKTCSEYVQINKNQGKTIVFEYANQLEISETSDSGFKLTWKQTLNPECVVLEILPFDMELANYIFANDSDGSKFGRLTVLPLYKTLTITANKGKEQEILDAVKNLVAEYEQQNTLFLK